MITYDKTLDKQQRAKFEQRVNYVINKVLYDDCHALRLFSNALISVFCVILHSVYTLVLSVVILSNSLYKGTKVKETSKNVETTGGSS